MASHAHLWAKCVAASTRDDRTVPGVINLAISVFVKTVFKRRNVSFCYVCAKPNTVKQLMTRDQKGPEAGLFQCSLTEPADLRAAGDQKLGISF